MSGWRWITEPQSTSWNSLCRMIWDFLLTRISPWEIIWGKRKRKKEEGKNPTKFQQNKKTPNKQKKKNQEKPRPQKSVTAFSGIVSRESLLSTFRFLYEQNLVGCSRLEHSTCLRASWTTEGPEHCSAVERAAGWICWEVPTAGTVLNIKFSLWLTTAAH